MRKILLVGLFTAAAACAQGISVAAYAGAPFTDVENNASINGISYLSKSPNFTVGAGVQVNLPINLRLELDALARPASFKVSNLTSNTSATEWRFPFLLQYRLGHGPLVQPFVGVGASFNHFYQIKNAVTSGPGSIASNSPGGMIIDAGLDLKLKVVRLSGELRYTREFNAAIVDISQLNQAEVLVGVHF
jgi:hypothetical protein